MSDAEIQELLSHSKRMPSLIKSVLHMKAKQTGKHYGVYVNPKTGKLRKGNITPSTEGRRSWVFRTDKDGVHPVRRSKKK